MATPPPRGVGITCTSRSRGAASIRARMAAIRTTGVVRNVTSAAVRRTTAYSRTGSGGPRGFRVGGVGTDQVTDAGGDLRRPAAVVVPDGGADERGDRLHVALGHALGRHRGTAHADARGD